MKNWIKIAGGLTLLAGVAFTAGFNESKRGASQVYTMYGEVDVYTKYPELIRGLTSGNRHTTIDLHIFGPGGLMSTARLLNNLIALDGPKVRIFVDDNIDSADTLLAFAGDELIIAPRVYFMFHRPVWTNGDGIELTANSLCASMTGRKDRGQDAYQKCIDMYNYTGGSSDNLTSQALRWLTADELKRYKDGYNVYVWGEEIQRRMYKEQIK